MKILLSGEEESKSVGRKLIELLIMFYCESQVICYDQKGNNIFVHSDSRVKAYYIVILD